MKRLINSLLFEVGYIREHGWGAFASTYRARVKMRFQKLRKPKIARVQAKPGVGRIHLVQDGIVLADLVLINTHYSSRDGASASFVDYTHYMKERRV